jgi:hypothetical protein
MFNKARRMFRIDMQKLRSADSSHLFPVDLVMLFIVLANLLYLLFGFLFQFGFIRAILHSVSPAFDEWYAQHIFPHIFTYDLLFVFIYILELAFRWVRSMYRKKYDQWWFYPFVQWYDVLMCIPLNSHVRFLGLLRLFGLFYRLQRLGVFDITKTYFSKKTTVMSEVMIEEVSDRVIAKMISMAQNEIAEGSPVIDNIVQNVIRPREEIIVSYISSRISEAVDSTYEENRDEMKVYLERIISEAVKENKTVDSLRYIPGLGKIFQDTLDRAVGDITFKTIDKLLHDLSNPENTYGIHKVTKGLIRSMLANRHPQNDDLRKMVVNIAHDSLEEIKKKVLIKEWKLRQLKEEKHQLEKDINARKKS